MRKNASHTLLALAALLTAPAFAWAEAAELDYRRHEARAKERPAGARPAPSAPPAELRKRPAESHEARRYSEQGDRSGAAWRLGLEAGARAARQAVDRGRFEHYEVGFYRGLKRAVEDEQLGRWDYLEGRSRGARDPAAGRLGSEIGVRAAEELAAADAEARVEAAFRDLSGEPRRQASVPAARLPYEPPPIPAPSLRQVFADHPLHGAHFGGGRLGDPWRIYRCASYRDLYVRDWADPRPAFERWRARDRERWSLLAQEERSVFRQAFREAFRRQLDREHPRLAAAYERGFDRGWDYGAEIRFEWSYRLGLHEAFVGAVERAAEASFDREYPHRYRWTYARAFDRWAGSTRSEILAFRLVDGNEDGVFEPGEEVLAYYELVNYGGTGGEVAVDLDGPVLRAGAVESVHLPRRSTYVRRRPLEAVIDPATKARTVSYLTLEVEGDRRRKPLRVAHPLELGRPVSLADHGVLGGWAELAVEVRNISRRPQEGLVELVGSGGRTYLPLAPLGRVAPGGSEKVRFRIEGLHPLDLLAGGVEVRIEARLRGALNDRVGYRLPELAADLANRDLLTYMSFLAREGSAPHWEVERAQELMLRRLEADWRAAVAEGGNPYRKDFKERGRRTALGDLVDTYRRERTGLRQEEVFADLVPRIEALAADLPGTHPFLRRFMKKLGRELRS